MPKSAHHASSLLLLAMCLLVMATPSGAAARTPHRHTRGCTCDGTGISPAQPRSLRLNPYESTGSISPTSRAAAISPATHTGISIGPKVPRSIRLGTYSRVGRVGPAVQEIRRSSTPKERVAGLGTYSPVADVSPVPAPAIYIAPKTKRTNPIDPHRMPVSAIGMETQQESHVVPVEESVGVASGRRRQLVELNPYERVAAQSPVAEKIRRSNMPRRLPSSVASHVEHPAGIGMSLCDCPDHATPDRK